MSDGDRASPAQRVLVIIPTYNERDNIERDHRPGARDACPTAARARRRRRQPRRHRRDRRRAGRRPTTGCTCCTAPARPAWARPTSPASAGASTRGYDVLVEMDADGSHAPEQLPRLLGALEHADLVLGSRWVPGGAGRRTGRARARCSRAAATSTPGWRWASSLRDATGGYRAYRRAVLEAIDYAAVASQGYCFQVDLAWRAVRRRLPGRRGADHLRRARARRVAR